MTKKSITKNYIYNTLYRIFIIIVPLITTPYIVRILSPDEVGINSYVSSVINVFTTIGLLGLTNYSVREIAYVRHDKTKTSQTFYELFFIRILLLLLTTAIYVIYAILNSDYSLYYTIYIFTIIGTFLDISWFFQGQEEFKLITIRSFIFKTLSTASIFIFVRNENDLPILMLIYSFTTIVSAAALFIPLHKFISKPTLKNLNIKRHLIPSLRLFLPQVATLLYCQMDKIMIGNITSDVAETGFYNQAEKIIDIPLALVTSLSIVMLPRISEEFIKNHTENIKNYIYSAMRFSMMLTIPLTAGIASIASGFIPWFLGPDYYPVISMLILLSMAMPFIAISNVSGNQYLTATNNTKILTISYCSGAFIDIALNAVLIPFLGANGAVIATIITEMSVMIIQLANTKIIKMQKVVADSLKYVIGSFLVVVSCLLCSNILKPSILLTTIQILLSTFIYSTYLFILKDKMFMKYITKILRLKTNSKPTLYIVTPKISIGGMERALITLLRDKNFTDNYEISLLVAYATNEEMLHQIPKNVKTIVLTKSWNLRHKVKAALLLVYHLIVSAIQYGRYDISICYSHHHGILAKIARLKSQNNAIYIHADLIHSRNKQQISKLCHHVKFNKFKKIICISDRAKNSFLKIYPNYQGDISVIYNLIDYNFILSSSQQYVIPPDKENVVFLNVSRQEEDKNKKISRIISAAKKLAEEKYHFRVVLIGDGKEHQKYCEEIYKSHLDNYFSILGSISNPFPYFLSSDAIIVSSSFEGYGIVIDEAKVLGLPVISTDIADAKKMILPHYGMVCENSTDGVYLAMKAFLDRGFKVTKTFDAKTFNAENVNHLNAFLKRGLNDIK